MKKKLLSLLLAACMILPIVALLPLPLLATPAYSDSAVATQASPLTTSFPGTGGKNLPTLENGTVTFNGNWSVFSFINNQYSGGDVTLMTSEPYAGFVTSGKGKLPAIARKKPGAEAWKQLSHMTLTADYTAYFQSSGQLNVTAWNGAGIRYTAEATGKLNIVLDRLGNFSTHTGGTNTADYYRYAVYVNGEMIWPVKGGALETIGPLSSIKQTNVSVAAGIDVVIGDTIDFVCQGVGLPENGTGWEGYGNAMHPTITYTEAYYIHASAGISLGENFTINGSLKLGESADKISEAGIFFDGVAKKAEPQSDGTWRVVGPAYNAKNIVDEVTIRPYYVRKTGETVWGKKTTTSVAKLLLAYTKTDDKEATKYSALAAATLEYAANAQKYFGYSTGNLANKDLVSDTAIKGIYDKDQLFVVVENPKNATVLPNEVSLLLRDTVGIHMTFKSKDGFPLDMSGYKLQISDNAAFTTTAGIRLVKKGDFYVAEMEGISARNWNESFYFRVLDASGKVVSPTFTYGVSAYYARMSENDAVKDLVSAMMLVYEASRANVGGSTMDASSPAMTPNSQTGTSVWITASNLVAAMKTNTLGAGKVYTIGDSGAVTINLSGMTEINGNGAVITATNNITFTGASSVTMKNLTIVTKGSVNITSSNGFTMENVEINAAGNIAVASSTSSLSLHDCRFVSTSAIALNNSSVKLTAYHSYFQSAQTSATNATVEQKANDALYEDCVIYAANGKAVNIVGSDNTVRYCTLRGSVISASAAENLLVAACFAKGASDKISFTSAHNSTVILNDIKDVIVKNSTSTYIVKNSIWGTLTLDNSKYLLVNGNALQAKNALDMVACAEYSGDDVTDVTARADYGVNEDLLPKVDKDAHINMTRKTTVRTVFGVEMDIAEYINSYMESGKALIVAPGAYKVDPGNAAATGIYSKISLNGINNADLYAYGVLCERTTYESSALETAFCENVGFYGLTFTISVQSSGQVQVLKKYQENGEYKLLCVVGAGVEPSWNEVGGNRHEVGYRQNSTTSYAYLNSLSHTAFDANGYVTFTVSASAYDTFQLGDVITCRKGVSMSTFAYSSGILLEDVTILGGAIRVFWDDYCDEGTTINRVLNTRMPAKIIDKATYDRYKAIEKQYGVNTGVYIDEHGNYRGAESRSSTADFAHANGSRTGFKVYNSIVDGLTDDGSNNQGIRYRVYGYDINTGKLLYRNDSTWGYGEQTNNYHYVLGLEDTLKIFTMSGQMLAETPILKEGELKLVTNTGSNANLYKNYYEGYLYIEPGNEKLAEAIKNINPDSLDSADYKIYMDPPTRGSANARFDNVLFKDGATRNCLIKAPGAVVQNCSFIGTGMAAVGINFEPKYGEGGLPTNVTVKDCYFEGTGHYENKRYYSPISIDAPAVKADEDYMTCLNVLIEGNVFRNRYTSNALYIAGSANVIVRDNDFGDRYDGKRAYAVCCEFVRGVQFSGNTYSSVPAYNNAASGISCSNHLNLYGKDIDGLWSDRLVTDASYTTSWVENIPYVTGGTPGEFWSGDYTINFRGNWDAGFVPVGQMNISNFKRANTAQGGGPLYLSYDKRGWGDHGAISTIAADYRFIVSRGQFYGDSWSPAYNPTIRYTMDKDATVGIALAEFFPPYPATDNKGSDDGLFAIFVNNKMVWPTNGGSYTSDSAWLRVSQETNIADINESLKSLTLNLKAGDQILFMAKLPSGSLQSMFGVAPNVYYLSGKPSYVPSGNQTRPDDILNKFF